ncbi:MAG TPA: NAD(P)H-hydrate epimerase, partial [Niastella sp.]|nr:NAD(P)H-hydrate epimerase [Niastella sp.]
MKILNAQQVREADAYTINHEPIAAIDLMERAAQQCVTWMLQNLVFDVPVFIFCGKGGNGGDGLAIARLLAHKGIALEVYILEFGKMGIPSFQINLERLHQLPVPLHYIQSELQFPKLFQKAILVDALYGVGLDRPLDGISASLVQHMNASGATIISVDLPSGLFPDVSSRGNAIVKATYTLTFECYKLGLLVAENSSCIGQVHVLPINLHPRFLQEVQTNYEMVDAAFVKKSFRPRNRFSHKGTFGHALLTGGSYGKTGAVVLATRACLRSGAGLVTTYIPKCGYTILQTNAPEAMTLTDDTETCITKPPPQPERFDVIGIG